MSVDKNLFLYDLAIVAIFKDEARYLKEWVDYHLLAGVDHFYLYNNNSSDNYAEVLAPYVEANLVTLIDFPDKMMQIPAYDDALRRFRFFCRYMAFIDLDEFVFPQTNQSIVEVADEIFSHADKAAGLAINWQIFGSNGQETADYSKGVLERFTRRAPRKWVEPLVFDDGTFIILGNLTVKLIVNPRVTKLLPTSHIAYYLANECTINENGKTIENCMNEELSCKKIVINHYYIKSREEFFNKRNRGYACETFNPYDEKIFNYNDRNDEFDDGILTYRDTRAEKFSITSDEQRIQRVERFLVETLTQRSPLDAPKEFFVGNMETFLTCRSLAELLGTKIGSRSAEEFALVWIYQSFLHEGSVNNLDLKQFLASLPDIIARPFPFCKKILRLVKEVILPQILDTLKESNNWTAYLNIKYLQQLLNAI